MNCRAVLLLGFASIAILSGGCGTVENLQESMPPKSSCGESWKSVYGGVRKDCSNLVESFSSKDKDQSNLILTTLDVPFSLIGDTITLPYTVAYETGVFGIKRECHFSDSKTAPDSISTGPVPPTQQLP
jgi:uncharacterized protein YceK